MLHPQRHSRANPRTCMSAARHQQRGIGFLFGLIIVIVICFTGLVAVKAVPTYLEYQSIRNIINELRGQNLSTPKDIRSAFDRMANVNGLTSLTGADLILNKAGAGFDITVRYDNEVVLMGPVSLLIHYKDGDGQVSDTAVKP